MFDMKNLEQLGKLTANAAEVMKAFWTFGRTAFAEGSPSVLQKQLIVL